MTHISASAYISPLAVIGSPPEHHHVRGEYLGVEQVPLGELFPVIGDDAIVEALVTVDAGIYRATDLGPGAWLMKKVHVGHDSHIGAGTHIAPLSTIGGSVWIGDDVRIGMGVTVRPFTFVGEGARIGQGSAVVKHIGEFECWAGNPARLLYRLCEVCGARATVVTSGQPQFLRDFDLRWYDRLDARSREAFPPPYTLRCRCDIHKEED